MALHDQKCPCMTPNGPKTLPMGILHDIVSCWTTLGPFQRPRGAMWASEKATGWSNMAYNHVLCPWEMFHGHLGSCRDILGHEGSSLKHHFGSWRAILGHEGQFWWYFGPFWVIKGYFGGILGHFGAPVGLWKGPRLVQHDIISCNIPVRSILRPFGVMQGHFGSWRAILGHEGPFLVLLWAIMGPPWASEKGPGWSNMTYNHVIYPWEVF